MNSRRSDNSDVRRLRHSKGYYERAKNLQSEGAARYDEATSASELPTGGNWQYEPKWDGFRCLAFKDGDKVELQSKAGKLLTRYFPTS